MKKYLSILCSLILISLSTACGVAFDGSRTGNDNEFVMDFKVFNKTDSQDLIVEEGDTIHAKINVEGGGAYHLRFRKLLKYLSMKV